MPSLLRSVLARRDTDEARAIASVDDFATALAEFVHYQGNAYTGVGQTTWGSDPAERIPASLEGYARDAFAASGVVFACMAVRMLVFSGVRFQWQRMRQGRASEMFGTPGLAALETPWPGGTTQDLLLRTIQDADLAGNSYWALDAGQLVRLRPDWVQIILEPRVINGRKVGFRKIGYTYHEGGIQQGVDPAIFSVDEVSHFAPTPDPLATYRGMSWLTPVLREIGHDKAMGRHKGKFFENAATPNLSVSLDKDVSLEAFKAFREKMDLTHRGLENAYRTLYLGGGADVKVVGADFKQMDFKVVQGAGETRIAAAAGVPPIIVGLSEGLESATYSNYGQARRRFADGTMHPLWGNAAGSFAPLLPTPPGPGTRLWYDPRDVPFLREDQMDAAAIQGRQADTIRTLIEAGFYPETAVRAVDAEDFGLLKHTGMTSVQLQKPGEGADGQKPGGSADAAADDATEE